MAGGNLRGAALGLLAFALFSTQDVIVKILGASYSPVQILFFAGLLGFPLTTLILLRDASGETLIPRHPWWMALRTAAVMATGLSAFYAFSVLPLAQVYAVVFATPLLITLLSIPVLGERVRLRRWLAVLVGLAGVIVVLRPGQTTPGLGHLAALTAATGGALAAVIVRRIGAEERSIVMLLYPMMGNFVVLGLALGLVYRPMPALDFGALGAIAVLALMATAAIIAAYKTGEAVIVAPMQYSQILWATLYGALIFGERPDAATFAGAAIIIASGLYILLRESRVGVSVNRPVSATRSRPETGVSPRVSLVLRRMARRGAP